MAQAGKWHFRKFQNKNRIGEAVQALHRDKPQRVSHVGSRLRHGLAAFKGRLKALEAKTAQENLTLAGSRPAVLERAKEEKEARDIRGAWGTQDACCAGNIKGVGHIYRQAFIDACTKAAFCKLCGRKNALAAAGILNGTVIPFFDISRHTAVAYFNRPGGGYRGNRERRRHALCLDPGNIDRTKAKAGPPRTNGTCGRFKKTYKDLFYAAASGEKAYRNINGIQLGLDKWIALYNHERARSGKHCYGYTAYANICRFNSASRRETLWL
jgi:hypothetical protein